MKDTMTNLNQWLNKLNHFSLPHWDALPDLDLYMDQVLTYLERELAPLTVEDQEKMMTSWMINNYVKGKVLPNPIQKKYSKNHLGYMLAICAVKQVLSISDIARLFNLNETKATDARLLYDFFRETQTEKIQTLSEETKTLIAPFLDEQASFEDTTHFLYRFVFKLAIEAEAKKIIANKILYLISQQEENKALIEEKKARQELEKLEKNILSEKKIKTNKK